ncbi:Oidioi.mRNA.OKI2018_I69.XSR.g16179.t1.cds [Oikopleura dioica]|uniref:Oidioi.mRNA.OKI2018_I69.XSR.g16179.t1.cds n=1 Tax=Oikopleura dioica TaxID=34765 RepID=A0ABN7SF98_OIKDI|nr:Oidioi.mRNA.OKI2018_I69.XSR.g16179.t1.cds [Oikopleura dioica]
MDWDYSFDKRLEKDDTEYREILQRLERLAGELKEERLSKCFEKAFEIKEEARLEDNTPIELKAKISPEILKITEINIENVIEKQNKKREEKRRKKPRSKTEECFFSYE